VYSIYFLNYFLIFLPLKGKFYRPGASGKHQWFHSSVWKYHPTCFHGDDHIPNPLAVDPRPELFADSLTLHA
jgi:hypothetical protein